MSIVSSEANAEQFLAKVNSATTHREVFEHALAAMLAHLNPERALVAYRDKESDELSAQACHGLDPQTVFVAGEISTELIKNVMRDGQSMCLVDASQNPALGNRTSVILSGLRSIVCVPIVHPSRLIIGLAYADNRIRAGAFDQTHQAWLESLTSRIAQRIVEIERANHQEAAAAPKTPSGPVKVDEEALAKGRQLAFQQFREGKVSEAIGTLQQTVKLAEALGPKDPRWGKTLGELAEMQRQAQSLPEAERNFIQAVDLLERLGPSQRGELAPVLTNLATLYYAQGNGLRSEGMYRRALEIWQGQISADDKRLAPLYFNLATLRRQAGATDEARQLFQRALAIAEKNWGPDHPHSQRCRATLEEMAG
jgi:tetratricopeptide (TPR) repeat protein